MSKTLKIILIVVAIAIVSGIGYWAYIQYRSIKGPQLSAIEAIDDDVVFFLQSDDIRNSLYKLTAESQYWKALLNDGVFEEFQIKFQYLDSLISTHAGLNEIFELNHFTLSFNKNSGDNYNFIFMLELPPGDFSHSVEDFVKEVNGQQSIVLKKEQNNAQIVTINLAGPEELFYFTLYNGLFIGSFDELLVEKTVSQLNDGVSLAKNESFARIHSTAGKNVEANIYINTLNFSKWSELHLSTKFQHYAKELLDFGYWTEMDLLVNSDDLLFNGYSITTDSSGKILNRFRTAPQLIKAPEILPYDISWMMHLGLWDFNTFLNKTGSPGEIANRLTHYNQKYGINMIEEFASWIGNEIVLAGMPSSKGKSSKIIAIHSNDIVKAVLALGAMEAKVNRHNRSRATVISHNDFNIRKLGLSMAFVDMLGEPFPEMKNCYYVALKDYILFAKSSTVLKRIIDHFYLQKTLQENVNYISFSNNISDRSNIYLYCNIKNPDPEMDKVFSSVAGKDLMKGLHYFEGIALQFSFINNMFYTNMFLSYNPEYKEIKVTNWEVELESEMIGKPHLVKNHRNGKTNIVVFDKSHNMYLIDHVGRMQWQMPLIEAPKSDIYLVDYYGNDKYQYLFNTENYVYLVDLNGNYVADFPRKLMTHSTNPMAAFDYNDDKNYRLFIALEDNKVYNFDKELKPVDGWTKVQASGKVSQEVQYLSKGGKDYLFVSDENGKVSVVTRRGKDRGSPKAKVNKAKNSSFYVNRTNSKGVFITTDTKGKVVYINETGKIDRTAFGKYSPNHYFFYEDFDQDDHLDFMYLQENNLIVYNRFKKIISEHHFEEKIVQAPVLFKWAGRLYMGVIFDVAGEIRIYDFQGRRFQDQHINGNRPFVVGSLDNGSLNLITGKGRKVMNYELN